MIWLEISDMTLLLKLGKIASLIITQYTLGKKAIYPVGLAYGYSLWFLTIFVTISDIILIPFAYRVLHISRSNIKLLNILHQKLLKKKEKLEKGKYFHLFYNFGKLAIVGITATPFSGGVWTGTILSNVLHLEFKQTFLLVSIGSAIGAMIFYLSFTGILSIIY